MKMCLICRQRNMDSYGICPSCTELNKIMREKYCDLSGKFAVVTGGRIKIGYAVCLRLLRQGASVIAVTRYPKSALENYMAEPDYEEFKERLYIIGFDLMRVDLIQDLIFQIENICQGKLDILVNNAAQTVKKSINYYAELNAHEECLKFETEKRLFLSNNNNQQFFPLLQSNNSSEDKENSDNISQKKNNEIIIDNSNNQLADYGETPNNNSWVRKPEEISAQELLEVQLINVTAPFLLTNGLKKCMAYNSSINKFVINVSSVEGLFNKKQKLARHIHTNMAKASLNMMTHSIASDFMKDKIYVYSCDPGWVSNQFPPAYEISKDFKPYLTYDDGAARILYPITKNLNSDKIKDSGLFYKDYKVVEYG